MASEFFDIVVQTEYMIELKPIDNIEDCGDDFLTKDEVEEMGLGNYWYGNCKRLIKNKVKAKIASYLADIPKDKKSIIIKDDDLVDALKETDTPVSDMIPNTRRVGNRLYKHTKKEKPPQTEVIYKNWTGLINLIREYLNDNDVAMNITVSDSDRVNTIKFLKPIATFKQLKDQYEKEDQYHSYDEDEYKWMENLYNDPSLAPLPKTKK